MKHSNKCWLYASATAVIPDIVRLSELPDNASEFAARRYYLKCEKPTRSECQRSPNSTAGRRKVSPRPGVHCHALNSEDIQWHYARVGKWVPFTHAFRHAEAKRSANRTSRRKTKVYFAQVDPDGDYNARLCYGLNEYMFS